MCSDEAGNINHSSKTCISFLTHHAIYTKEFTDAFFYIVPKPTVSLRSDLPNPVLFGSSLTLTCTAELSSVVNISYSVSTMWKGPEGTVIISSATTEMVSFTLYTLSTALESVNSGEYSCTMNFGDGVEVSASTSITTSNYIRCTIICIVFSFMTLVVLNFFYST